MDKINYLQMEFEEEEKRAKYLSATEALLFVSGEPLAIKEIARVLELEINYVKMLLNELGRNLEDTSRGVKLIALNDCYQLVTKSENSDYIQLLLKKNVRQTLSQASLESLAIIAYRQPITRIEIDEIRGVKSDSAIQKLIERNLIKEVGRLEVPGRPIQFGTTEEFLRQFNLHEIKELPSLDLFEVAADENETKEE